MNFFALSIFAILVAITLCDARVSKRTSDASTVHGDRLHSFKEHVDRKKHGRHHQKHHHHHHQHHEHHDAQQHDELVESAALGEMELITRNLAARGINPDATADAAAAGAEKFANDVYVNFNKVKEETDAILKEISALTVEKCKNPPADQNQGVTEACADMVELYNTFKAWSDDAATKVKAEVDAVVKETKEAYTKSVETVKTELNNLYGKAEATKDEAVAEARRIASRVETEVNLATQKAKDAFDDLQAKTKEFADTLVTKLKVKQVEMCGSEVHTVSGAEGTASWLSAQCDEIKALADTVKNKFNEIEDKTRTTISNWGDEAKKAMTDMRASLETKFNSASEDVKTFVNDVADEINGWYKQTFTDDYWQDKLDKLEEFGNTVKDGLHTAGEEIANIANKAAKGFCNTFKFFGCSAGVPSATVTSLLTIALAFIATALSV